MDAFNRPHVDDATYEQARSFMERAREKKEVITLNLVWSYVCACGAVRICACERCDALRQMYVTAWKEAVAEAKESGEEWTTFKRL